MLSSPNSVRDLSRIGLPAIARTLPILAAIALAMCGRTGWAQTPAKKSPFEGKATAEWLQLAQGQPPPNRLGPPDPPPVGDGFTPPGEEGAEGEPSIEDPKSLWDRKGPPMSADCCKGCPSFWYGQFDAWFVDRSEADRTQLSANLFLSTFDYHTGTRITIGRQADCLEALEFVYTGANNWENRASVSGAALQSIFIQGAGIFNLDDFDNALTHAAVYETSLNSFEFNRRRWGWDIISTVIGFRFISIEDRLLFTSLPNPPAALGEYRVNAQNNWIGGHLGGDMLYPVGPGLNIAIRGKFGAFLNNASQDTTIINNGAVVISNGADKIDYSLLAEFGGYMTYRVRPRLTLKAGYEFWYMYRTALAPNQMDFVVRPGMAGGIVSDSTLTLNAFTTGAEFQW